MWSWVGHRITGVVIFFFLLVHVLDTSLVRVSPEAYTAVIGAYKNPLMALGETGLVAAIVFHAFNGLRVIAVDFCCGPSWRCGWLPSGPSLSATCPSLWEATKP
jgi:succinate dehydrogenase / fumarate reductase cytochrome b subunit